MPCQCLGAPQWANASPIPLGWKGHLGDLHSDFSVVLLKESEGTQLAPPDPIFFTQAVKNNPYIQCSTMKDFSNLQNTFHVAVKTLHIYCNPPYQSRNVEGMRIYPLVSGNYVSDQQLSCFSNLATITAYVLYRMCNQIFSLVLYLLKGYYS